MRGRLVAAAVVVLALMPAVRLLWLSRDVPNLGFYHDDALYWVTAKSLAEGTGYRVISLQGSPCQTKYPPLFSWLLSFAWRVNFEFPANLGTAVWIAWLPLPFLIWLSHALLKQWGVGRKARTALCAVLALNPCLTFFSTVLLSEIWATCFLLASLVLAGSEKKAWWFGPAAGLCAGAAYLTKTVAAPLLIAIPLVLLWRRRRGEAALFLACALPPIAAWHLWAATHRAPATDATWLYYVDYLALYFRNITPAMLPSLVYRNLGHLLTGGGDLLLFRFSAAGLGEFPARLLMIAALAGVIRWTRSARRFEYVLFAAGEIALLLVWHYPPNERFLIPLLPLLLMGLWTEAGHIGRLASSVWQSDQRVQRLAAAVVLVLLAGAAALFTMWNLFGSWRVLPLLAAEERRSSAAMQPLYRWIRENTPDHAIFFADHDPNLYLYTGRQATSLRIPVRYFHTGDRAGVLAESAKLTDFALSRRVDYLLLTPSDFDLDPYPEEQRRAAREPLARDARFQTVFRSPAGTILKVKRDAQ